MLISKAPRPPLVAFPRPVLHRALGEATGVPRKVTVLVQDLKGRAFSGVEIAVGVPGVPSPYGRGVTNGGGAIAIPVLVPADAKTLDVSAELPEGNRIQQIAVQDLDRTIVTFRSISEAPQAFMTPLEYGSAIAGLAVGASGFIWKIDWMKVLGESLFVVALFSKFARAR